MIRAIGVSALVMVLVSCGSARSADPPTILFTGDWSKSVADTRGYAVRGRLVLCEKARSDEYREAAVYIELQDARESVGGESTLIFCDLGKTDFRPEYKGGLTCELRGADGQLVKRTPFPFSGAVPASQWVGLPSDGTIRLRTSPFGIRRINALAISPDSSALWVIENDDPNAYFLTATLTVDPGIDRKPPQQGHIWRGTLDFPRLRIVQPRKLKLTQEWVGLVSDPKLLELAPPKGYLTDPVSWKKLWTAWQPDRELPKVDFARQWVLVATGGNYPIGHDVRLSEQGDLSIRLYPRVPPKPGAGFGIAVIDRTGVRSIRGQAVTAD